MIRFSCTHCGRAYLLADAMAHLPLLCKGCGQRLVVPDPQPEPPPPAPQPVAPPAPKVQAPATPRPAPVPAAAPVLPTQIVSTPAPSAAPVAHASGPPAAPLPVPEPPAPPPVHAGEGNGEFISKSTLANLDLPVEPPPPRPWQAAPAPAPAATVTAAPRTAGPPVVRKVLAVVVDVVVTLALLGLGVLLGEFAARKPTREIIEGMSGPRFPSVDLLVWLGGPALLGLLYLWLATRGWTAGAWLKRRGVA